MTESSLMVLIGVLAGLTGASAGIGAIIWGLGLFEYMGGKKPPPVSPINKDELRKKLIALNSPASPVQIRTSDEADLVIEWKIVDARWFAIFAKERLSKTYRAFMVLDDFRRSVRYCEELSTVQWVAGSDGLVQPVICYQNQFFRGRILFQKSWVAEYGIKEDLTPGKVYAFSFDIAAVREPIKKTIVESGWEFVPVIRKRHATYKSLTTSP